MTTKDQERQAIEKIRKIVEGLGENSYVGFAMEGVLELAEDNIREDTAYSMKKNAEIAWERADKAEKEKGKKEEIRHTIQVFDGCAEEIAEYECKEDCLIVLYAIFKAIEQGGKTAELPAREEMKEQREALKQYLESGKKLTEWTAELLKELLDM